MKSRWFRVCGIFALMTCWIFTATLSWAAPEIPDGLVKTAQKEKELNWATGILRPQSDPLCEKFEKKYGIKVNLIRMGTEELLGRFMVEMEAGGSNFDLVTVGKPPIGKYKEKGWVAQYFSPRLKAMSKETIEVGFNKPDGWWTPTYLDYQLISYSSKHIPENDAPKSWLDLLDPKYKNKMAHADPRYSGTAMLTVATLAKHYGWGYYEKLGKQNLIIGRGHGVLMQYMVSGERPISAEMLFDSVAFLVKKGEPLKNVFPSDGSIPTPWQSFLAIKAPHPNAAKLFLEFLLTNENQAFQADIGCLYPVIVGVAGPSGYPKPEEIKLLPLDIYNADKNGEEIKNTFWNMIGK